jgi:hypothetical protein
MAAASTVLFVQIQNALADGEALALSTNGLTGTVVMITLLWMSRGKREELRSEVRPTGHETESKMAQVAA